MVDILKLCINRVLLLTAKNSSNVLSEFCKAIANSQMPVDHLLLKYFFEYDIGTHMILLVQTTSNQTRLLVDSCGKSITISKVGGIEYTKVINPITATNLIFLGIN